MRIFEHKAVIQLLLSEVQKAGSQTAWANRHGLDRTVVNQVLHGTKQPCESIIRALGLRIAVTQCDCRSIVDLSDVARILRADVEATGSQSAWSKKNRISRPFLNKVLRKRVPPSKNIICALRLRIVVIAD